MQDADGDTSPATLTIIINGANDSASVVTAETTGPDATVYESGLNPDGSNAAANTETTTGTFTVSASDGIASVVIGGTSFTLGQVQVFATTNGVVNTGQGVLTLTDYSGTATGGTISYSYTLSATIDNTASATAPDSVDATGFNDSVALTVNGVGGTTASDDLVIRIVNDLPTANVDGPYGVTEDGLSNISGDVVSNDTSGADTPAAFVGWSTGDTTAINALNTYGTLTQNADGTWSYALNNALAATQALTSASNLSYDLHYTMQDADGDTSPATLTIIINGANDSASVVTAETTGPDATVYESGLNPDGSNAAANTETTTGTFTVSASDGIASVVIGGTSFTLGQVQVFATTNGVVNTGQGVLTLTDYSGTATGGTISYSYTLSATIDNTASATAPDSVDATGFNDSVALTVNGVGGTTASDDLVIRIVNDLPTANVDGPYGVTEDGLSNISGDVVSNDTSGADTPAAFVGWSTGDTTAINALNTYGTLTQNADGTWSYALDNTRAATQALTSGSPLSYDLHYTMQDADGDTSPATLTIIINGANDSASVVTAETTGPDATVYESGLNPDGSNAAANTETTTGTFTVSASDGIASVVIGGTSFTLGQVQVFATTNGVVNTGQGVLTLTDYSGTATGGTISYSYTLSATIDNTASATAPDSVDATGFNDSVALTVNGVGGTTASDDLVIRIVNDLPTANVDGPYGVTEDGLSNISGDVVSNDTSGADTPAAFVGWSTGDTTAINALNTYGTLTQNADGTWSYALNNALAATQALTSASNLSYDLHYTMQDADGDTSPATLTIIINGANDSASVVTAETTGPDATVYESGLNPDGSNAAANTETTTGTFTVSASDGIASVVIGGTSFTLGQVQVFATTNGVVNTGQGVLTLTDYSGTATGGTISYSYTLSATIDNTASATAPDSVDATGFNDSVALTVNGVGGTTASDDLVIRIVNDLPTANVDGPYGVTEDGLANISGDVVSNDTSGADTPAAFVGWSTGDTTAINALNTYGTLTQNADGTWSYALNNALAATQALTSASSLSYDLHYTMQDADGDTSPATLTIIINGANDSASVVTAETTGPDATVLEHGLTSVPDTSETTTGSFTLSATDGIHDVVIGGMTFTLAQVQAFGTTNGVVNTGEGVLTLTGYTGDAHSGTVNYSYTLSAPIDNDSIIPTGNDAVTAAHFDDSVVLTVNGVGGSSASDDLVIRAVDDVPTARADTDSLGVGGYGPETGNVITGVGTTSGAAGADTVGADGAQVSGVVSSNVPANSDTTLDISGNLQVQGQYGMLTLNADGGYSYVRDAGSPGGVSDVFTYTLTDGDGDTSPATLTISLGNGTPTLDVPTTGEAGTSVNEAGLPARGLEPEGSGEQAAPGVNGDPSETTAGVINFTPGDTPAVVTINGTAVTGTVGQTFAGTYGTLTITGTTAGTVSYSYTLADNTSGNTTHDDFSVVVTDADGDATPAQTLSIDIVDDVPTARADTDSLGVGGYGPETGNVITGVGTTSGAAGADTVGADGAQVSGVVSSNVPANSDTTLDISGNLQVQGQYGMLTLNADGGYSYSRDAGSPGGVSDVFTYTLTDGDGDPSTATLTISLGNGTPTLDVPTTSEAGTSVNETGLPARGLEPEGSGEQAAPGVNGDPSETTAGVINFTPGDTPAVVTINGTAVTGTVGQTFAGTYGTLTITGTTAGTVSYSYTLADNTSGNTTHDDFSVVVTDADGDATPAQTLSIDIVDDVPTARADTDSLGVGGYGPETGNVITGVGTTSGAAGADTVGADGAQVSGVVSSNVPANSDTTLDISGNLQVQGQYGMLTLNADGGYSYVRDAGSAGGVSDVFTYTLTDGDGDPSTATLTISLGNGTPTLDVPTTGEAGTSVNEAGLPARGLEPEGSGEQAAPGVNGDPSETTAGVINFTPGDTPAVVTINGTAVTGTVGQTFAGTYGTLTITGTTAGTVSYSYTLADNTSGNTTHDDFSVVVTDADGDATPAQTLRIDIVDDVPTARADTDSLGVGGYGPETGNVITGVGTTSGAAGADTVGADGAQVSGVVSSNVPANSDTTLDISGNLQVQGQYGMLTLNADGGYSYVRDAGSPGGVSDVFTYTLTDGDGDPSTATLTISLGNGTPTLDVPTTSEAGTSVNETGLPARGLEPEGSGEQAAPGVNGDPSETTAGVINFTPGDTPAVVTINGTAVTGTVGQTFAGTYGTLTITGTTAGTVSYSYTLADNTSGNTTHDDFSVVVTDADGDATPAQTLSIDIVDDVPTARADTDSLGVGGYGPETGNVITGVGTTSGAAGADTVGADGAQVSGVVSSNVPANSDTTLDISGNLQVQGQYGMLTLNADGGYSYVRDAGSAGGVSDVFTYTLTDGDGDPSTATLTISLGNGTPTLDVPTTGEAGTSVNEAGLPARGLEPEGSGEQAAPGVNGDPSETTAGVINFTPGDTPAVVTINGTAVTGTVGQTFAGTYGTLTITGTTAGTVSYSYTLADNTSGNTTHDDFSVVVTDADGDATPAQTLRIDIVDDVPTARADTDSLGVGGYGPETGNVITGVGTTSGAAGADTVGADGAHVSGVVSSNVPANSDTTLDISGNLQVQGQYGVLTLNQDGSYSYVRDAGSAGGVSDVFTYTLTDGDGDPSTATLTISLGNGTPTLDVPTTGEAGTSVNEAGLPARGLEPEGSGEQAAPGVNGDPSETTAGVINYTPGDTPAVVTINGTAVSGTVGQTFAGTYGTLTITGTTVGTVSYSYTLADNTSGNTTHDDFSVVVTDADGDATPAQTLSIAIVDDVPHATDFNGTIHDGTFSQVLSGLIDYGLGADGFGGVTLSLTGATSGGSPISLTSHGHAVTTAAIDSNGDGLQELVGFVNVGGTSGYEAGTDTLVFDLAPHTAGAAYGTYDLTLYDVLDLQAPVQTFTVGGGIQASAPGAGLLITNGVGGGTISVLATPESGHTVNSNTGELGIDNTILNANEGGGRYDEKITLQFGTAFSGTTVTTAAVLNDVHVTGINVGSGTDSFGWVAYKGGVQVGASVTDLSMSTVSGQNEISPGIHVEGGYDTLKLTMTGGDFKLSGFTYTQQGASIDTLLNFGYTAADAGHDTATGNFSVTVSDTHVTGLAPGAGDLATIHDILTG